MTARGGARTIEFNAEGTVLVEATTGGGLAVWDLDVAAWADRACRIAGRSLTAEEWRVFVGDLADAPVPCTAMADSPP